VGPNAEVLKNSIQFFSKGFYGATTKKIEFPEYNFQKRVITQDV